MPKSKKLFEKTKKIIENKNVKSVCGFTKVKTHPFQSWYIKKIRYSSTVKIMFLEDKTCQLLLLIIM